MAKHGKVEQIQRTPQWRRARYEAMTKYIEILGAENPALFANLPDETAAEITKTDYTFKQIRLSKPWVLTLYPTAGFAEMEGLPLDKYTGIIVKASTTNPKLLEEVEKPIAQLLGKSHRVRIETQHPKTGKLLALEMDITGRKAVQCTGKENFPDGEVFTSPNANSPAGEIFVDLPIFCNGVTIEGIYLEMKEGKIINYSAEKEFAALKKIIETDEGSHRIGEVALGMNRGLQTALKHPLFVEKVGGTLHIAIGDSIPESYVDDPSSDEGKALLREFIDKGIYNKSSQHVDIVTDFRPGGAGRAVFLDNTKLKIKDNIWVV